MSNSANPTVLAMDKVNTYYGHIHAIKSISLEVKQGEIVALIGANGAGKSTIMTTIMGITPAKDGCIRYQGQAIEKRSTAKIVEQGMVLIPEGRRIFPEMTVAENLSLGAYVQRHKKKEVEETLAYVLDVFPILHERYRQNGATLSGGEQQMLAIARGLMSRPQFLLFDEPSLGLAPKLVEKIFQIIWRIRSEGVTVLLVEQNARAALALSDRGYVLETGKVVLQGDAKTLKENDAIAKAYLGKT